MPLALARMRGVAPTLTSSSLRSSLSRHSLSRRRIAALTMCRTLQKRTRMKGCRRLHLEAAGCAHQVSTNSARRVHTQHMLSSHVTSVHASAFLIHCTRQGRLPLGAHYVKR